MERFTRWMFIGIGAAMLIHFTLLTFSRPYGARVAKRNDEMIEQLCKDKGYYNAR